MEYDPEVIHLISRRAQTDRQTDVQNETININIQEKKNKRKRVVITNDVRFLNFEINPFKYFT